MAADDRTKRGWETDRARRTVRVVRRGVVAINGSPRSWKQEVRAVLLAAGPLVAASHGTALRLLGGEIPRGTPLVGIHVVAPR